MRYALAQNYISVDPTLALKLPKLDNAARPVASDSDLTNLMSVAEYERDPRRRARERAMLYVLVMTGIRFSELLNIKVDDVDLERRTLRIAHGKGDKMRMLYPPPEAISALAEWIIERRKMAARHDWFFAYDIGRRMGELGTRQMLEDLKARAGLSHVDTIKPHSLRRAFATRMLRAGADIKSIQAALGHSMAQTTFIYLGAHDLPAQAMSTTAALPAPAFSVTPPSPKKERETKARETTREPRNAVVPPQSPSLGPPARAEQYYRRRRTAIR